MMTRQMLTSDLIKLLIQPDELIDLLIDNDEYVGNYHEFVNATAFRKRLVAAIQEVAAEIDKRVPVEGK